MLGGEEAKTLRWSSQGDILTDGPNPVLFRQLTEVRIMSEAWAEKHNVIRPRNFVENPNWWSKRDGNVTEIVYRPIKLDATRKAALLSGEIDLVLDPPVQDIERLKRSGNIKIVEGTRTGRSSSVSTGIVTSCSIRT